MYNPSLNDGLYWAEISLTLKITPFTLLCLPHPTTLYLWYYIVSQNLSPALHHPLNVTGSPFHTLGLTLTCTLSSTELQNKVTRKVQVTPQSQTAANPRHQEEEKKEKTHMRKTNKQMHEKHKDQPPLPQTRRTKNNTGTTAPERPAAQTTWNHLPADLVSSPDLEAFRAGLALHFQ